MKLACNAGNLDCLYDTFILNKMHAEDDHKIPNGLENVIFCSGFRGFSKRFEWVAMWKKLQLTSDTTRKGQLIAGLGCSDDQELLKDYLESTLGSGNSVNYTGSAERRAVVTAVLNSYSGFQPVINFFRNFQAQVQSTTFGYGSLVGMVSVPARAVKTAAERTIFMDYLTSLNLSDQDFALVSNIVQSNFANQVTSQNIKYMYSLRRITGVNDIEDQLRLPKTSKPKHYDIHIDASKIHTGDRNFTGEVGIHVVVTEPTYYIMLHSKTQVIEELKVNRMGDMSEVEIVGYNLNVPTDTLTIYFPGVVAVDSEFMVHIKYATVMPTSGTGFYMTTYNLDGIKYVGSTQFQPSGARYTFPNYDEPGFKAKFNLKITHDASFGAIANTFGEDLLK